MPSLPGRPVLIGIACAALILGATGALILGQGSEPVAAAPPAATPTRTATPRPTPTRTPRPTATPTPTPEPVVARCPLTGLPLDDASVASRTPILVQIENHPDARPASNLSRADIAYEPVTDLNTRLGAPRATKTPCPTK